jgi:hypothetical protein
MWEPWDVRSLMLQNVSCWSSHVGVELSARLTSHYLQVLDGSGAEFAYAYY